MLKHSSIRVLLALGTQFNLELEQMDVKITFLHGNLKEMVLMAQPEGFVKQNDEAKICLLKKMLYGLKNIQDNGI